MPALIIYKSLQTKMSKKPNLNLYYTYATPSRKAFEDKTELICQMRKKDSFGIKYE